MKFIKMLILLLCLQALTGLSAQPVVKLFFEQDSVALGEVVSLTLEVQHDPQTTFFFPDRRREFLPLEWVQSERLQTQKQGQVHTNRMVYQVRTFSLEKEQSVNLPYAYFNGEDTLYGVVQSAPILLAERIPEIQDSLAYKVDKTMIPLGEESSLQQLIFILIGIGVLLGILYVLLRRPIAKLLERRKLYQEWQQVRRQMLRLEKSHDQDHIYNTLSTLWRHWLDPEESYGLPSMTSTELQTQLPRLTHLSDAERDILLHASKEADQVIYAGKTQPVANISELIRQLLGVMGEAYKRRDMQIRKPNQA